MGESAHVANPFVGHREPIVVEDLRDLGMDETEIRSTTRVLWRARRGAYVPDPPTGAVDQHRARTAAVLRQHSAGVAASHTSAALVHGFPLPVRHLDLVHVTAISGDGHSGSANDEASRQASADPSGGSGRRRASYGDRVTGAPRVQPLRRRGGVRHGVHTHVSTLPAEHVEIVEGLLVTDAIRTVIDCAMLLPFVDAVVLTDHALHFGLVTLGDLTAALTAAGRRKGVGRARRVLACADAGAESPGESRLRLIVTEAGYAVESQVELRDPHGRLVARVDLKLRDYPVVLEFDGRVKYGLDGDVEKAHWDEKRRHDDVENLGYVARRFRWENLGRPSSIVRVVDAAVERVRRRGGAA